MKKREFLLLILLAMGMAVQAGNFPRIVAVDQATTNLMMISVSPDLSANIYWRWSPWQDKNLQQKHIKNFGCIDECKPIANGEIVLINASYGGVAMIDVCTTQTIWYAVAPKYFAGPHSVTLLPDGRVAVANSTGCDKLEIFDTRKDPFDPAKQPHSYAADIPGAHGVDWNANRNTLFVLGHTNVFEFAYLPEKMSVKELHRWSFDKNTGDGWGHDLVPDGKGAYYMTNHSGVWHFNPENGEFTLVRDVRNAKSFSRSLTGQDLCVIPREKWWTDRFTIFELNDARHEIGPFSGARFYKARWILNK